MNDVRLGRGLETLTKGSDDAVMSVLIPGALKREIEAFLKSHPSGRENGSESATALDSVDKRQIDPPLRVIGPILGIAQLELIPGKFKISRPTGPGAPCWYSKCGKPIPAGKKKTAKHCDDRCKTLAFEERREFKRLAYQAKLKIRARYFLLKRPMVKEFLVQEAEKALRLGRQIRAKGIFESRRGEYPDFKVDNSLITPIISSLENEFKWMKKVWTH